MNRTRSTAFNCPVCQGPSQSMVFGLCQHFVCAPCLYEPVDKSLRPKFDCCPICEELFAFPDYCPVIPDTSKDLMEIVGVVKCPRKRCGKEIWASDMKEHEKSCRGIAKRSSARGCGSPASASTSQRPTTHQSKQTRSKRSLKVKN